MTDSMPAALSEEEAATRVSAAVVPAVVRVALLGLQYEYLGETLLQELRHFQRQFSQFSQLTGTPGSCLSDVLLQPRVLSWITDYSRE